MKWQLDKERYLSRQTIGTGSDVGGMRFAVYALTFLWLGYAAVAVYDALSYLEWISDLFYRSYYSFLLGDNGRFYPSQGMR